MPELGGPSTQSGVNYQNSVTAEFLFKLMLAEDDIESVQVEAPEACDDIVVFRKNSPTIYIEVKESPTRGTWTATKLDKEKFWENAKNQIESNKNAIVWLVTSTAAVELKELTDRVRRAENKAAFNRLISDIEYLNKEYIKIKQYWQLNEEDTTKLLSHIYIQESYGSTEAIENRVRGRIKEIQGKNVFSLLRDFVSKEAGNRKKIDRNAILQELKKVGIINYKTSTVRLVLQGID